MELTLTVRANSAEEMASTLKMLGAPALEKAVKEKNKPVVEEKTTETNATEDGVTIEELRKAITAASKAGHKDSLRNMFTNYGCENVTQLPKEEYTRFMSELKAL